MAHGDALNPRPCITPEVVGSGGEGWGGVVSGGKVSGGEVN